MIDKIKSWLWWPVIAILLLIIIALEKRSEKPRKEATDIV